MKTGDLPRQSDRRPTAALDHSGLDTPYGCLGKLPPQALYYADRDVYRDEMP